MAKRRGVDPATSEIECDTDELELLRAIDAYKRRTGKKYPTYGEVLKVFREFGWERKGGDR